MANVKQMLKSSLDELLEAELKEFQWYLTDDHRCVSKAKMENADRLKTVDKMVSCFGPKRAVEITVETLRKIKQNHLAEELENTLKQDQKTSEIWEKNKAVRRGGWRLEDQNSTPDTLKRCNTKVKIHFKRKVKDKQGQVGIRHSEASARDLQDRQSSVDKADSDHLKQVQEEPKLSSEIEKNHFFDAHRLVFIERVINVHSIADKLLEQRIIHEELYSVITQTNVTRQQIMRKIYDSVGLKGEKAKARFIDILQEEEPYLLEDLMCSDS